MEKAAGIPSGQEVDSGKSAEKPVRRVSIMEHTRQGGTPCLWEFGLADPTTGVVTCERCGNPGVIPQPK